MINEWRRDGYLISTDKRLLDLAAIHGFLARSYWAAGVPLEVVEHHFCDVGRLPLRIGQGQRRSPRAAEHQPPVNVEMPAQPFNISEKMVCRIGGKIDVRFAGMRSAFARTALIE